MNFEQFYGTQAAEFPVEYKSIPMLYSLKMHDSQFE
jgi:hypothetical protein